MREHEARSRTRGDRLGVTDSPVCERLHGQRLWSPYISQHTSYRHSFTSNVNPEATQKDLVSYIGGAANWRYLATRCATSSPNIKLYEL